MFRKSFSCIIFVLFFGVSFITCIRGDFNHNKDAIELKDSFNLSITDWWQMFRHDLSHSGYSSSSAPNTNFVLWNFTADSSVHSSPAIVDGKVYFGSMDLKVYCLNAINGTIIWDYTIGHPVSSSPAVHENMVYIGSNDAPGLNGSNLYCLNASTGEKIWEYATGESIWGVYSSPAVADGKVYFGSGDYKIYCLNAITGIKLWEFLTNGEVVASPAVNDGKLYIGSHDGIIYCLNASTGAEIWLHATNYMIKSSPTISNGKVYIGSDKMYCLNAENGTIIWQRLPSVFYSSPAVFNNRVYVCDTDYTMYCFNADNGMTIWQYETGQGDVGMWSSPAVADGKVYVGSRDGKLYCFDADTGEKIWDYLTGYYPIFSSPAVANGRVYIGDMIGNMYCFGNENYPPNKPNIYGPDNGTTNVEYTFCTDTITDPEGDSLYCSWDWDDGNISGWLGPYSSGQTICASHKWTQPGIYCITLKLKDVYGMESKSSDPFCITIVENQPPTKPVKPSGPTSGTIGVSYPFSTSATDPENYNVAYGWDWNGDGTVDEWDDNNGNYYTSGQTINTSHSWSTKGKYKILVKAKDVHGYEGSWSDPLEINIPRNKQANFPFFIRFLQRLPILSQILKNFS